MCEKCIDWDIEVTCANCPNRFDISGKNIDHEKGNLCSVCSESPEIVEQF